MLVTKKQQTPQQQQQQPQQQQQQQQQFIQPQQLPLQQSMGMGYQGVEMQQPQIGQMGISSPQPLLRGRKKRILTDPANPGAAHRKYPAEA